jgi:hypothetical protein
VTVWSLRARFLLSHPNCPGGKMTADQIFDGILMFIMMIALVPFAFAFLGTIH